MHELISFLDSIKWYIWILIIIVIVIATIYISVKVTTIDGGKIAKKFKF
jgi:hypothetical protein